MSNFLTAGTITYNGKQTRDYVFQPFIDGLDPATLRGIKVMRGIKSKTDLHKVGIASKIAKKYAKGASPVTGAKLTQQSIDVTEMQVFVEQDERTFVDTAFEEILGLGYNRGNIAEATTEELVQMVVTPVTRGLGSDYSRQFFFGDTDKEKLDTVDAEGHNVYGNYSGVADDDYNAFDGVFKKVMPFASTTPNYANNEFFKVEIANGSVKQVDTVTVTGTSGTANVNVGGVDYLATFATDLATTTGNFVVAHATALLARGIVVTNAAATLVFTAVISGSPFDHPTITNATGDLAGSVANTTANTAPTGLAANKIKETLDNLYSKSSPELRAVPKNQKVIYMDSQSLFNYVQTLDSYGSGQFSIESGKAALVNGQTVPAYRGIPIIEMDWETWINTDFPHADGELAGAPFRILYTTAGASNENLVLAVDDESDRTMFKVWYNDDDEYLRWRCRYQMGAAVIHSKYTAIAF